MITMATSRLAGIPLAHWLLLVLLGTSVVPVEAVLDVEPRNTYCIYAIMGVYGDFSFVGGGYDDYYDTLCQNHLAVVSLYAAVKTYCSRKDGVAGIDLLADYCVKYGETKLLPASTFAANLTPAAIATLPVYSVNALNETLNQTSSFLMDREWFDLALHTEALQDNESYYEAWYGAGVYGFWFAVLVFGMLQNLVRRIVEHRRGWEDVDAEGGGAGITRPAPTPAILRPFVPVYAVARKYFVTPALLPKFHQRKLWGCTLPTRAETFVVAGFWIYSLVTCSVNYYAFQGNLYWANIAPQIWNHIAWRTGTESYFLLPLIWLFSSRNNICMWLTGWQYSTFSMFHRHVARIATIEGIMHSVGWTAYFFAADYGSYFYSDFKEKYFYMGAGGTVVMSLLMLFSFSYFRTKFYESFLLIHIIFSVLLVMFLWYHTNIFNLVEYNNPFILPPIIIWALDRFLRLVRQAWCNLYVGFGRAKTLHRTTRTTVAYSPASSILTVDIVPGNGRLHPGPGQHYYLYQPFRFLGWENHPFTLAHWYRDSADDDRLHLVFNVRVYDGWTKSLRKQCEKATATGADAIAPRMILEGPYGRAEPLHTFDQVLLIAGGSGIAAVMPYVLDHIRRVQHSNDDDDHHPGRRPTRTHRLTLVWTDRHSAAIETLARGALAPVLARDDVRLCFHQTSSSSTTGSRADVSTAAASSTASTDDVSGAASGAASHMDHEKAVVGSSGGADAEESEETEKSPKTEKMQKQRVHIQAGRPDVASIIQAEAETIYGTSSRLAVMACGPATLSDAARHATARAMEKSKDSIEYFEENFGW